MNDYKKDLSYGMWAFNYIFAMAASAGMGNDKRILSALKYISLKSRDQQSVKAMVGRTVSLIRKSPGYIAGQLNTNPFTACPPPQLIDGEIKIYSGASGPVLVDYPNELSYFSPDKMKHKVPRDGKLYYEDIKDIFPEELQNKIYTYSNQGYLEDVFINSVRND